MTAREKVAMALQAAEADCLERGEVMGYSVLADAAIAAHLEELRLGTIAALAKQIAIRDYSNSADQRAALDILAILERAGVDV